MAGRRPGHPRLPAYVQQDVDARHRAGHDELSARYARRANQDFLSSPRAKNISLNTSGKSDALSRASWAERGALANVINAARDAVDAEAPNDERRRLRTAKACGPDAPVLASSLWIRSQATVARKPVTGESAL
jgi:hypothetical protein